MPGGVGLAMMLMLLAGCASTPPGSGISPPAYPPETLECVADSLGDHVWRPCVSEALQDWAVWVTR